MLFEVVLETFLRLLFWVTPEMVNYSESPVMSLLLLSEVIIVSFLNVLLIILLRVQAPLPKSHRCVLIHCLYLTALKRPGLMKQIKSIHLRHLRRLMEGLVELVSAESAVHSGHEILESLGVVAEVINELQHIDFHYTVISQTE